jgi:hypothetical protein
MRLSDKTMGNLREEFNRLAQKLAAEAENRRQFVASNKRETQQMRQQNLREREQVARELTRQARSVTQMLDSFTSTMRRGVARTMAENRDRRLRGASEQANSRRQTVASVRRHVSYSLERHRRDRVRNARQQARTAFVTMQSIRQRVSDVRNQSLRLTAGVSADLAYGRQALAMARRNVTGAMRRAMPMNAAMSPRPTAVSNERPRPSV